MSIFKSLLFWTSSILFAILMFPITVLIWLISYPFDRERIMVHWWLTFQGVVLCKSSLLWDIKIEGREKAKRDETYIIISNHQSILDIILITCLRYRMRWISKIEVFKVPVLSWSMKMAKYIPIVRGDNESKELMLDESIKSLRKGISIMLFPEGTRSSDGMIRDFRKGAFQIAISAKLPILPILVDGTGKVLPKKGIVFSGGYLLKLKVMDPVYPSDFGTEDPVELAYRFKNKMESTLNIMRKES